MLGALLTRQALDSAVKVAILLCYVVLFLSKLCSVSKPFLKLNKIQQLIEEPVVDHCYIVNLLRGYTALQSFKYTERTLIVNNVELLAYLISGECFKLFEVHCVKSELN